MATDSDNSESIRLLTALRAEWIQQRDSWHEKTESHDRCRFAIYALDEAIHSLEKGFVWRYHAGDGAKKVFLFREPHRDGYGPLYRRRA